MAGYSYTRINNPTIESFEKRMAKLEGGIGSVACSSGMAALSMALMNVLQRGDHVVAAAGLYGGTVELLDELKVYGVTTTYVKVNTPQAFEAEITPETRAVLLRQSEIRNWMSRIFRELQKLHINMEFHFLWIIQ